MGSFSASGGGIGSIFGNTANQSSGNSLASQLSSAGITPGPAAPGTVGGAGNAAPTLLTDLGFPLGAPPGSIATNQLIPQLFNRSLEELNADANSQAIVAGNERSQRGRALRAATREENQERSRKRRK